MSALSIEQLRVDTTAGRTIVDGVSLEVQRGEILALVGESGSGKTTTALAALGYARRGAHLTAGRVVVAGQDVLSLPVREQRRLRGRLISYVPQDPGTALNPAMRIGAQIAAMVREHQRGDDAQAAVGVALERAGLPSDRDFCRRYPHQLSGGQQQRVAIAIALVCEPPVVVLDEPTTALDVVTQARLLDEVRRLRDELGVAMVYVSHDLAVVASIADRIAVMYGGVVVEQAPAAQLFRAPEHEYTRRLLDAVPDPTALRAAAERHDDRLLVVNDLAARYPGRGGDVSAAQDISFAIETRECVALVGESGSGKTTIARCIAGLHAPSQGTIALRGEPLHARAQARTREQRRRVQMVFQNPYDSLNPRHRVGEAIMRTGQVLRSLERAAAEGEARELLERVRLPQTAFDRYPMELSGGERQRVAIARALIARPELLICDEITSALDVSVQAMVLELLDELRRDLGLAMLFITHDLGVVAAVADRVLVLESGRLREEGRSEDVLLRPEDAYTKRLLAAAPTIPA
jgi:peptide/nickel transport system ATP-binding protein